MTERLLCRDGSIWVDTRETVEEWAKKTGGVYSRLLELKLEGGKLSARIRTAKSWDGVVFSVPETVTWKMGRLHKDISRKEAPVRDVVPF